MSITVSYSISIIAYLALIFYGLDHQEEWIFPWMVLFAEYGVAAVFTIIFVAHSQIFPVLVTATTLGVCNFASRCLAVFSPMS
jgi:hypothetical protein